MILKLVKTHENAILPSQNNKATNGASDTGYDLYAVKEVIIPGSTKYSDPGSYDLVDIGSAIVPVGLEISFIDPGYWLKIEGRSGLGFKHGIQPHNGIIDNQYRGDLGVKLYNLTGRDYIVKPGDKIAQLVAYKLVEMDITFTDTKEETNRGEKGFGSSGK
jgi:dUTP pyrophosphatase